MKAKDKERQEAQATLRKMLAPGATLYTVLRHTSASGMSRNIDVFYIEENHPMWLSYRVAKACDMTFDKNRESIKVGGAGMDMGFHVVHNLSRTLFPDGFGCIGKGCPSNDHSNGDRDYTPDCSVNPAQCVPIGGHHHGTDGHSHWHKSGGYALKHRWM